MFGLFDTHSERRARARRGPQEHLEHQEIEMLERDERDQDFCCERHVALQAEYYSTLMFASLMIGVHFSSSALRCAASAAAVCCSGGGISCPRSARRWRTAGSASVSMVALVSRVMTSGAVPFGAHSPNQVEM